MPQPVIASLAYILTNILGMLFLWLSIRKIKQSIIWEFVKTRSKLGILFFAIISGLGVFLIDYILGGLAS